MSGAAEGSKKKQSEQTLSALTQLQVDQPRIGRSTVYSDVLIQIQERGRFGPHVLKVRTSRSDEVARAQPAQVVDHRRGHIRRLKAPSLQVREVQQDGRHDAVVVDDDGDRIVVGRDINDATRLFFFQAEDGIRDA